MGPDEVSGATSLRVAPLRNREKGANIVMVSSETRRRLGIEPGDVVEIEGAQGRAAARVWVTGNADVGTIQIGPQTRRALSVGVGDVVAVEPVSVREADSITVALPEDIALNGEAGLSLRNALDDRAVLADQLVSVRLGFDSVLEGPGQRIPVAVVETDPSGPVVVREWSRLIISDKPAEKFDISGIDQGATRPTYEDIGGLDAELDQVRETIELPMSHPEQFQRLGVDPPTGLLLYGPSGTGKTLVSKAVANELDVNVVRIRGSEISPRYYDESVEQLRDAFSDAEEHTPTLIIIDELDTIAGDRGTDADSRLVGQLLSLLDGLGRGDPVTVIGTTNRIETVDPALRRPGRFDREIEVDAPDRDGREEILEILTREMRFDEDVDLGTYAENTHGFVGADLESLVKEAAVNALRRANPEFGSQTKTGDEAGIDSVTVTDSDFRDALTEVEPSALREVRVEVPDISWDDVGGLDEMKARLRETVQWPLEHPKAFDRMALEPAKGVLLHGPPGTGKTLLAKAVANESRSNFISVKGPELLNKYVGESEKGIREVFSKARQNAPAIIFFDEIDAIAAKRGGTSETNVGERVVSQFLTELDGLEELENVVVVATTNRKDLIDDALLRAGRIEQHLHVPTPDAEARREIFAVHTRDRPVRDSFDFDEFVDRTEGCVGADIEAICREAAAAAVREYVHDEAAAVDNLVLTKSHFEEGLEAVEHESGADDPLPEGGGNEY